MRPILRLRKHSIRDYFRFFRRFISHKLVRFLPIARPMCQLQVGHIRRMPAAVDRDNVINARRHRIRIPQREINRPSAYPAHGLRCIDPAFVFLKGRPVLSPLILPVLSCHTFTPPCFIMARCFINALAPFSIRGPAHGKSAPGIPGTYPGCTAARQAPSPAIEQARRSRSAGSIRSARHPPSAQVPARSPVRPAAPSGTTGAALPASPPADDTGPSSCCNPASSPSSASGLQ